MLSEAVGQKRYILSKNLSRLPLDPTFPLRNLLPTSFLILAEEQQKLGSFLLEGLCLVTPFELAEISSMKQSSNMYVKLTMFLSENAQQSKSKWRSDMPQETMMKKQW